MPKVKKKCGCGKMPANKCNCANTTIPKAAPAKGIGRFGM